MSPPENTAVEKQTPAAYFTFQFTLREHGGHQLGISGILHVHVRKGICIDGSRGALHSGRMTSWQRHEGHLVLRDFTISLFTEMWGAGS